MIENEEFVSEEVFDAEILYRNLERLYKEIASRVGYKEDFTNVSQPLKDILEETKKVLKDKSDYSLPY